MWLLRLLGILSALAIAGSTAAYFLTRDPRYLTFAWRTFRYAVIVALLIFALLILERVVVLPV